MTSRMLKSVLKATILICAFIAFSSTSFAFQTAKKVSLSSIYKEIIQTNNSSISYNNIFINDDIYDRQQQSDSLTFIESLEAILNIDIPYDSLGILSNFDHLSFNNVNSKDLELSDLNLDSLTIGPGEYDILGIYYSNVSAFSIDSTVINNYMIYDNVVFGDFRDYENRYNQL